MSLAERIGLPLMRAFEPERAHGLALKALQSGLVAQPGAVTSPRLTTSIAGLHLPNPLGLAAGFDKNATAIDPLLKSGFGFVEVGAATPRPQPGNPQPRLFRLTEDAAAINRFGFNNDGMETIRARLAARRAKGIVGINLGANKDSADRSADFATVLAHLGSEVDFATVNVSSPNTESLRDLHGPAALRALLARVMETRDGLAAPCPIFLKIAPDLTDADIGDIAKVAMETGIDGVITTNTTLSRHGLKSRHQAEVGGLSGQPLFERSTAVLMRFYAETGGALPLIGVGGIGCGAQAYAKIRAGASALQLYTALVYGGLSLVQTILGDLDATLERDGFASLSDAVGVDHA